jgi:hypothetical protein
MDCTMHTESTPITSAAGEPQGRVAAVTELLANYRSNDIERISQPAQLLGDLRLLADAQGLDLFRALDASYFVYMMAKAPAELS